MIFFPSLWVKTPHTSKYILVVLRRAPTGRQALEIKRFPLDQVAGWRHKEAEQRVILYVLAKAGGSDVQQLTFRTEEGAGICEACTIVSEAASGQAAK